MHNQSTIWIVCAQLYASNLYTYIRILCKSFKNWIYSHSLVCLLVVDCLFGIRILLRSRLYVCVTGWLNGQFRYDCLVRGDSGYEHDEWLKILETRCLLQCHMHRVSTQRQCTSNEVATSNATKDAYCAFGPTVKDLAWDQSNSLICWSLPCKSKYPNTKNIKHW